MGRYYSGDIEGKFWFGIQPSNAADRFGVCGTDVATTDDDGAEYCVELDYSFELSDLPTVTAELTSIIDTYFIPVRAKNMHDVNFFLTATLDAIDTALIDTDVNIQQYADFYLGRQIYDCLKSTGQCYFTAEC